MRIRPVNVRVRIAGDLNAVEGAFGIQRLPGKPIHRKFSARDPFNDFSHGIRIVASNPCGIAEFSALVGLKIWEQTGGDSNALERLEERSKEMVTVRPALLIVPLPIGFSILVRCGD